MNATGADVADFSGADILEEVLHAEAPGFRVGRYLVYGQVGRSSSALRCDIFDARCCGARTCVGLAVNIERAGAVRETTLGEEVRIARVRVRASTHVGGRGILRREGEQAQVVVEDVSCHTEACANRGIGINCVVEAYAREEVSIWGWGEPKVTRPGALAKKFRDARARRRGLR